VCAEREISVPVIVRNFIERAVTHRRDIYDERAAENKQKKKANEYEKFERENRQKVRSEGTTRISLVLFS